MRLEINEGSVMFVSASGLSKYSFCVETLGDRSEAVNTV